MDNKSIPELMTIQQVAEYIQLHPLTVRRLAGDGNIPAFKIGRQWRIRKDLLDQWMETQARQNLANPPTA